MGVAGEFANPIIRPRPGAVCHSLDLLGVNLSIIAKHRLIRFNVDYFTDK